MPLKDLLFGFEGRVRRRDWWLWSIGIGIVWAVAFAALSAVLFGLSFMTALSGGPELPQSWTFTAYSLVTFIPVLWVQAALAAKRAHDRNHGALTAVGLTVLGSLTSFAPEVVDLATNAGLSDGQFNALYTATNLAIGGVNLYLLVFLGFLDGTPGPNRFGRSPKGIGGDPADKAAEVFS